ncbi:hypothetical protein NMY22_g5372 [Coprinellus aureogranulatus]|nr:hypothetical protein NMY22_g5372 [Coprinellus aureogranulatus]
MRCHDGYAAYAGDLRDLSDYGTLRLQYPTKRLLSTLMIITLTTANYTSPYTLALTGLTLNKLRSGKSPPLGGSTKTAGFKCPMARRERGALGIDNSSALWIAPGWDRQIDCGMRKEWDEEREWEVAVRGILRKGVDRQRKPGHDTILDSQFLLGCCKSGLDEKSTPRYGRIVHRLAVALWKNCGLWHHSKAVGGTMDLDDITQELEWCRKCICGKRFYQPNSYTNHINNCTRYKKGVGSSLQEARETDAGTAANADAERVGHDVEMEPVSANEDDMEWGRGLRVRKPVQRYKDFSLTSTIPFQIPSIVVDNPDNLDSEPTNPAPPPETLATPNTTTESEILRRSILDDRCWKSTPRNPYGLYKKFWTVESKPHDPDFYISGEDLQDTVQETALQEPLGDSGDLYPFPNLNAFLLGEWYWSDSNEKSRESFRALVDIITSEDFNPADIRAANWDRINSALASSEYDDAKPDLEWAGDGTSWQTTSILLEVPFNSTSLNPGSYHYEIPGFRYRPLVPVITERLKDVSRGEQFHIVPTDLRWQPLEDGPDMRVYGEMYNSPAFLEAFKEVQALPPEETESSLPRYVVALMFSSDATVLTSFGASKLWPVYMLYGNESKYRRSKPSLKLFEEIAYFQFLPDGFHDWYLPRSGKPNIPDSLSTHLNRELYHSQWRILLDDDFVYAYEHGIIVDGFDGFFPLFTIDDETHVIRCLISLDDVHNMGTASDRDIRETQRREDNEDKRGKVKAARSLILGKKCLAVNSPAVERLMKPTSLVPAQNAFSDRLSHLGFDVYRIAAVDAMHEVEIGVWKSLFIHLLRLLETVDKSAIHTLNKRFREVPGFGRDTIRRFGNNVSGMKQLAARDWEDLLQCVLPVFEGLLPGNDGDRTMDLLFTFAYWHSLVKLRLHTDGTLAVLDRWTTILGDECRRFSTNTCQVMTEVQVEPASSLQRLEGNTTVQKPRKRKSKPKKVASQLANVAQQLEDARIPAGQPSTTVHAVASLPVVAESAGDERREKTWNINTPKFHSLGDYPSYIRLYGTTDSYSTQLSEHFHRFPKSRYRRTNKKKPVHQISAIQTRQARIRRIRKHFTPSRDEGEPHADEASAAYFIGKSQNQPLQIPHFLRINSGDLAVKGFLAKLKVHLYPRVIERLLQEARQSPDEHGAALAVLQQLHDHTPPEVVADRLTDAIYIHSDRLYEHRIAQINFTTYDCRRDQDTVNASTSRRDVMCLYEESPFAELQQQGLGAADQVHPTPKHFSYARLLKTFHINIVYGGPGTLDLRPRRFDVLWVRWYRHLHPTSLDSAIFDSKRLETVSLAPLTHPLACGFIDPSSAVRAAHIIPRFSLGKVHKEVRPGKLFSTCAGDKEDSKEYYINPFADRDMVMRYHWGMGVGHVYSHKRSAIAAPSTPPPSQPTAPSDGNTGAPMDIDLNVSRLEDTGLSPEMSMSVSGDGTDSEESAYDYRGDSDDEEVSDFSRSDGDGPTAGLDDDDMYL